MSNKSSSRDAARKDAQSMDALDKLTRKIVKVPKEKIDQLVATNRRNQREKPKGSEDASK